jgi:hypothetical protein
MPNRRNPLALRFRSSFQTSKSWPTQNTTDEEKELEKKQSSICSSRQKSRLTMLSMYIRDQC